MRICKKKIILARGFKEVFCRKVTLDLSINDSQKGVWRWTKGKVLV